MKMVMLDDQNRAQQTLARIAKDYRCAIRAENEFIETERAHRRHGHCDAFAARFLAWLEASEPLFSQVKTWSKGIFRAA